MRRIGFRLRASSLIETVGDGGTPISFQLGWCRWCSNLGLNSFTPTRGLSKKETPKVPRPFTLACFVLFVFLGEAHPCEFTFAGLHQLALGRDSNGVRGGTFGALPSLSSILDNMRRVDVSRGVWLCRPSFARVAEDHLKSGSGVSLLCIKPTFLAFNAQVFCRGSDDPMVTKHGVLLHRRGSQSMPVIELSFASLPVHHWGCFEFQILFGG